MFTLLFLIAIVLVLLFVAVKINDIYVLLLDEKEKYQIDVAVEEAENTEKIEEIEEDDFEDAENFCIETKKASTSSLQTEFCWGYNKAASIISSLEKEGVIGPAEIGKEYREVLVKKEQN